MIVGAEIGDITICWGNLFKARSVPLEAQAPLVAAYEANKDAIDAKIRERAEAVLNEEDNP